MNMQQHQQRINDWQEYLVLILKTQTNALNKTQPMHCTCSGVAMRMPSYTQSRGSMPFSLNKRQRVLKSINLLNWSVSVTWADTVFVAYSASCQQGATHTDILLHDCDCHCGFILIWFYHIHSADVFFYLKVSWAPSLAPKRAGGKGRACWTAPSELMKGKVWLCHLLRCDLW